MQIPWRPIARMVTAIAVTLLVVYWLDGTVASYLRANNLYESTRRDTFLFVLINSGIMFIAFVCGGFVAAPKFWIASILLAVVMQVHSFSYWADWLGHSFVSEIGKHWIGAAIAIMCAVLGALFGHYARSVASSRPPAAT